MKLLPAALCKAALLLALSLFAWPAPPASAQGVTTGAITGMVKDAQGQPVVGAGVTAIHIPTGSSYETVTRQDGHFSIPNMRVGGPYTVTVFHAGSGTLAFEPQVQESITVNLGVATDLVFDVRPVVQESVTVTATSDPVFSSERTGAATQVSRDTLATLPTISGTLNSMTRLTPQFGGSGSFAGQDNRMNNITVDGSYFNNSFGLAGNPGERTGVAPISLSAIEQIQVSVAPFDVRQGNFVGAAVNTVTRSGSNAFHGSVFNQSRDNSMVGTKAKGAAVDPGTFNFRNSGGWASGPIVKNRAFFFFNYENESFTQPGTTFRANKGGEQAIGSVTRVLATDLDNLSSFLKSKFNYDTGLYQGYEFETPAKRILAKVDYNIGDANKLSVRYNDLNSKTDVLLSNSSSLGFGTRRSNLTGLNFSNSNYQILENIRSIVGEWNSILKNTMANNIIVGYTHQDESRDSRYTGDLFPFVDILEGSTVYTSFGYEPFSPNNELRYNTFQLQDNFTRFSAKHTVTGGFSLERYTSENVFFSGKQSVYVYNSLADFYTDANDYLANPNRTVSPVSLRTFQVRYNNIPGQEKPIQPLKVWYTGAYVQDDWRVRANLKMNLGIRFDVPFFGDTGYDNPNVDALTFRDENGKAVQYNSGKLPDANILWSPRLGFNWDVKGDRNTQVRGGTGIFTGKPAYVWISNQVGNTGMLTGFEQVTNSTSRPFSPDPDKYKPATVTGAPAASVDLAVTDPNFKFPQIWRNNIAVDQRLPWGWSGTAEFLYNRDVNGVYYINANLPAAQSAFTGADTRMRWVGASCSATPLNSPCVTRLNNATGNQVTNAIVLKNQNVGRSWNLAFSAERPFVHGVWVKAAYSYGEAKNTVDPGSVASGSWTGNQIANDPNNPPLAFSTSTPGHRFYLTGSYTAQWFKFGGTTVSAFYQANTIGTNSYTYAGDLNGDTATSNDLIYIPRNTSEMNFQTFTANGITFTAADQAAAWDAYISQDKYLSQQRGGYAARSAYFLPFVKRIDLSLQQDFYAHFAGARHTFQFRVDMENFGNLLNTNWGVGTRLVNAQPLTNVGVDANGAATYRLRVVNNQLMTTSEERTAGLADVYKVMISLRYTF